MGQRHQIYVKFPKDQGVAGFHHQWLYGMTAIQSLGRVLKFYQKQDEYGPLTERCGYDLLRQSEIIVSLYSTDVETGYWHYVHNLLAQDDLEPIKDPRMGDNNDGITIIDLSKGDFRYCFMSVCHLEGEKNPPILEPLSARDYLLCYYPKFEKKQGNVIHGERCQIDLEEHERTLAALKLIEKNAKLLTRKEVKEIFPAMFKKLAKRA